MCELKKGQVIKIYEDPITCNNLEGSATLISLLHVGLITGCETWVVKFVIDHAIVYRHINIKNH